MSSKNEKTSSEPGPRFIQLFHHLVDSQAWNDLSGVEAKAYIAFARKYNGSNNGAITMGVRELALRVPCDPTTAQKTILALEDAGLIRCKIVGTFTRKREASEYALTDFGDNQTWRRATQDYHPQKRFQGAHRKRYAKRCPPRGKSFKARRKDKIFCSDRCRKAHRRRQ